MHLVHVLDEIPGGRRTVGAKVAVESNAQVDVHMVLHCLFQFKLLVADLALPHQARVVQLHVVMYHVLLVHLAAQLTCHQLRLLVDAFLVPANVEEILAADVALLRLALLVAPQVDVEQSPGPHPLPADLAKVVRGLAVHRLDVFFEDRTGMKALWTLGALVIPFRHRQMGFDVQRQNGPTNEPSAAGLTVE